MEDEVGCQVRTMKVIFAAIIYLIKVNNRSTRKFGNMFIVIIKTPERHRNNILVICLSIRNAIPNHQLKNTIPYCVTAFNNMI